MANIKTIALSGAETAVHISGQNCDIRNDGTDMVYASAMPGVNAGADGVLSIPAGGAAKLLDTGGAVYLLGTGSVQLCGNDYAESVFKSAASASGGGGTEDIVARTAINTHAANGEIHVTASDKTVWDAKPTFDEVKSYVDNADNATLASAKEYADSLSMSGGGVSQDYVDEKDTVTLAAAKEYAAEQDTATLTAAQQTIEGHSSNADIHITSAERAAWNGKAEKSDIPTTLPANGGNAATVNGYTVASNVPANAKFTDTTYSAANASADGLMTAAMFTKLNGIAAGANKTTVDSALSTTSTNPVQNKVVTAQLTTNLNAAKTYANGKLITGTAAASTSNCPEGSWYGQYS